MEVIGIISSPAPYLIDRNFCIVDHRRWCSQTGSYISTFHIISAADIPTSAAKVGIFTENFDGVQDLALQKPILKPGSITLARAL